MNSTALTARKANLISCHVCHLLSSTATTHCPRCGSALHQRKVNSIARTWALLITACICYIPANVLPITIASTLGSKQADTIMSGVIYFIHSGSWEIATVIFHRQHLRPPHKNAYSHFIADLDTLSHPLEAPGTAPVSTVLPRRWAAGPWLTSMS